MVSQRERKGPVSVGGVVSRDLTQRFPDSEVTFQLWQLARVIQTDFLDKIAKTGLSASQSNVVRVLSSAEWMSQRELAERLGIGKASVGEALDKLEQGGFIVRSRAVEDRRIISVRLAPRGEACLEVLASAAERQVAKLKRRMGSDRVDALAQLLDEAWHALETKPAMDTIG